MPAVTEAASEPIAAIAADPEDEAAEKDAAGRWMPPRSSRRASRNA